MDSGLRWDSHTCPLAGVVGSVTGSDAGLDSQTPCLDPKGLSTTPTAKDAGPYPKRMYDHVHCLINGLSDDLTAQ